MLSLKFALKNKSKVTRPGVSTRVLQPDLPQIGSSPSILSSTILAKPLILNFPLSEFQFSPNIVWSGSIDINFSPFC